VAPALREVLDVRYAEASALQKLDVLAPADAHSAPVVLVLHGGGWVRGDKDFAGRYRAVGRFLARSGSVAVLVNYRLSPAVQHPEHVKDVARAFAWARRHAADYGGDPGRIFLCGHSAGGHLAALLATDGCYLRAPELNLGEADRASLRGVIGVSGVYRIPGPEEYDRWAEPYLGRFMKRAGVDEAASPRLGAFLKETGKELNPFRLAFGDDPEVCRRASPVGHVRPGLPPFLLVSAERDLPGLPKMADDFAAALRRAGVAVERKEAAGRTHNSVLFRAAEKDDPVGRAILDFIARPAGAGRTRQPSEQGADTAGVSGPGRRLTTGP
jgi:acetyl esterase/lipase